MKIEKKKTKENKNSKFPPMFTYRKKSQVSFEFIMIFTLVFFALVSFIYIANSRFSDIDESKEILVLKSLSNNIKNEVILALSVNDNYIRRFNIPTNLDGKDYKINLKNDELSIQIIENEKIVREHLSILPVEVKGTFIENITFNTTDHCITKNEVDGIRIARNQASLDTNKTNIQIGEEFDVVFSLNCVENIRSTRITLKYDSSKISLISADSVTRDKDGINPFFENEITQIPFSSPHNDTSLGRYSFGFLGSPCSTGSGNIAKFRFLANQPGTTDIEFDNTFDKDLVILDCNTNRETKSGLPDSKNSERIIIE